MSNATLNRVPARGITREEHDRYVAMTGRNYTDPYLWPHISSLSSEVASSGTVPVRSTGMARRDPKSHPPTVH